MKKIEITKDQLQQMIKEGVERIHRQKLIENRIEQINRELNALNNPDAWEDAHREAQNQLRKKTIAFNNMVPKERLMNEGLTEKGVETVKKWIAAEGSRVAAKKIIDSIISRMLGGMTSSDLPDTSTFANGLDTVEEFLNAEEFDNAYQEAKNTAKEMIEEEGGGDLFEGRLIKESIGDIQTMPLEQLIMIAKNAGDIVPDAEVELNNLATAEGNRGIPVYKVEEILANYDLEMGDVSHDRESSNDSLSLDDLANKGLLEKKYSDEASNFIGKEISHLMHDKNYEHDRAVAAAINIAKDKGYKIPKPTNEEAPSAGLSSKQKSNVVKKAKAGEDIGKKGKGFKDVVAKAKASGAEDPEAVAAAAMWKNIKRESIAETMKKASELLAEANKKMKERSQKNK